MTEFCSKITQEPVLYGDNEELVPSKPTYEITFSTNDRRYFDRVEEACRACIDKTPTSEVPKYVDTKIKTNGTDNDKTFDIVDAFMHLIWGRKVRMTHWDKDEYIKLAECNRPLGCECLHEKEIINQAGGTYPTEYLFDKSHIEAKWEDYKEE